MEFFASQSKNAIFSLLHVPNRYLFGTGAVYPYTAGHFELIEVPMGYTTASINSATVPMSEVKSVTPDKAWKLLQRGSGAVLIDVRSKMEYDYVGHPKGASHVPWQEWPEWRVNPHFVTDVRTSLIQRGAPRPETIPVLTLCRSGQRSLAAAQALVMAGFIEVYNVVEGFEGKRDAEGHRNTLGGWRFRGLPWEQT